MREGPELVVGLVGAVGTALERVAEALEMSLGRVNYSLKRIRLSELLKEVPDIHDRLNDSHADERYNSYMDAGNELRKAINRNDAVALLSLFAIADVREAITQDLSTPAERTAYLLWSLKTPEEVTTLRTIYGWRFVVIAAYSPRRMRVENIARRISSSRHEFDWRRYLKEAEHIVRRDESEKLENQHGQNVRETFPLADIFVNVDDGPDLNKAVNRAVEICFGYPFHSPTRDEYGMFHAHAAALRSASLGRQVGAALAFEDGDILTTGCNEVPRAGGGLYWCDDRQDHRDHTGGYDPSDDLRRRLVADVFNRLQSSGWLAQEQMDTQVADLVKQALSKESPLMKGSQVMNILEFGRPVHAEMAALMSAVRRGIAVQGSTLYVTTFPCHECARHIVAAGIKRVVYIEPYPKSLVPELYPDSISVDEPSDPIRVSFQPFVGIAPRKYFESFAMVKRKDNDGSIVRWDANSAVPKSMRNATLGYLTREQHASFEAEELLREKGLC